MSDGPQEQPDSVDKSLGDQATGADASHAEEERSLGDQSTSGDALSSLSDLTSDLGEVIDSDLPLVDLAARYQIEGELGKGGMGAVLLATDRQLKRKVAIKRILGTLAQSKTALQRFVTEAQSIAALNHFNIVQVYEFGRDEEGPFLVLEHVDGGSLLEKLKKGKLEVEEAVDITCQLCDGLSKAHGAGIIHRDIKPANILLTEDGAPKLTDFGLARQETTDQGKTQTGAVLGTIDFMPPEQRRDATSADARSDLWSLAATLYQMITGKSPKVIRLQDVPGPLQDVISQALEEDPAERYQDATSLRAALKTVLASREIGTQGLSDEELIEGRCAECGTINDPVRKFCKSCATTLREACLSCETENAVWERICGECGSNLPELIVAKKQEIVVQKGDVESLRREYRYQEAIEELRPLSQSAHPRFAAEKNWADETINLLETEQQQHRKSCQPIVDQGRDEFANFKFTETIKLLNTIPAGLRDQEILDLLEHSQNNQREKKHLLKEIKQQVAVKDMTGLLEKVNRLLELSPGHAQVMKLQAQLRARQKKVASQATTVLERAEKLYAEQQDEDVLKVLSHWPSGLQKPARAVQLQQLASDRLASASQGPVEMPLEPPPLERPVTEDLPTINLSSKRRVKSVSQDPDAQFDPSAQFNEIVTWKRVSILIGIMLVCGILGTIQQNFPKAQKRRGSTDVKSSQGVDGEKARSSTASSSNPGNLKGGTGNDAKSADRSVGNRPPEKGVAKISVEDGHTVVDRPLLTLKGHTSRVKSVAFSPDGKWIVSGGGFGRVKFWDAETGTELRTLKGHTSLVSGVDFSPNGKRIVSGNYDRTLKVWDAATGTELLTLKGHTSQVKSVAFSPDGKRIVSGSTDWTLKIWDAATGTELRTLKGHTSQVQSVAFSPDSKRIVSGSNDNTVKVWDAETGMELRTLKGHVAEVTSVAFSPDGKRIVSGSWDNTVKVWDAETGEEIFTLKGDLGYVTSVSFSPDGKRIVSGSRDSTLKVWDTATGTELLTLEGHRNVVSSVAYSPDGTQIVSGSEDMTIKIWDISGLTP